MNYHIGYPPGLQVGDVITRVLAGTIPTKVVVSSIDDTYIHCGPWKFLKRTGCEVDEEIGWDGVNHTGSFLAITEEPK